jgi:hypothetical protein
MNNNKEINAWIKPIAIIGLLAIVILAGVYLFTLKKPIGCFKFDDGTTQNWTLDQLYNTNSDPYQKISYNPFTLTNHQNIALEANASTFMILDKNVDRTDIYFVSPDISTDPDWNNIVGYSVDIRKEFVNKCYGDLPDIFYAQLQVMVIDKSNNSKKHYYSEPLKNDPNNFVFHEIRKSNSPYNVKYEFAPLLKVDDKMLTSSEGKLLSPTGCEVYLRIRITMTGYLEDGECLYNGKWKIGNVCPIK